MLHATLFCRNRYLDIAFRLMAIVAAIFTPLVLAYQGWTYWVFRARVTSGH